MKVVGVRLQDLQLGQHPHLAGYGTVEIIIVKASARTVGPQKEGKASSVRK